jgi:hypothetical protein
MEAAGIDVFATARAAGLPIKVVGSVEEPQNYYQPPARISNTGIFLKVFLV